MVTPLASGLSWRFVEERNLPKSLPGQAQSTAMPGGMASICWRRMGAVRRDIHSPNFEPGILCDNGIFGWRHDEVSTKTPSSGMDCVGVGTYKTTG